MIVGGSFERKVGSILVHLTRHYVQPAVDNGAGTVEEVSFEEIHKNPLDVNKEQRKGSLKAAYGFFKYVIGFVIFGAVGNAITKEDYGPNYQKNIPKRISNIVGDIVGKMSPFMWCVTLILAIPSLAFLQAAVHLARYRALYGEAPYPINPSHGLVVGRGMKYEKQRPLRLLVIGDSVAAGVGIEASSTPILPEEIAKSLSMAMSGRAIYWTCNGQPGASATWVVQELEQLFPRTTTTDGLDKAKGDLNKDRTCIRENDFGQGKATNYHDRSMVLGIKDQHNMRQSHLLGEKQRRKGRSFWFLSKTLPQLRSGSSSCKSTKKCDQRLQKSGEENDDEVHWRERLQEYVSDVSEETEETSSASGQYDVAIVFSGPNDFKSAFLPFMLQGEDIELYKQGKQRGATYSQELKRVIDVLSDRMKLQLAKRIELVKKNVETVKQNVKENVESVRTTVSEKVESVRTTVSDSIRLPEKLGGHKPSKVDEDAQNDSESNATSDKEQIRDTTTHQTSDDISGSKEQVEPIMEEIMKVGDMVKSQDNRDEKFIERESDKDLPTDKTMREYDEAVGNHRPIVVLPSLPCRTLPVLRWPPLRWLALFLIELMDNVKRTLAIAYGGDVLFVEAPTVQQMNEFENHRGPYYFSKGKNTSLLTLQDVSEEASEKRKKEMHDYYASKMPSNCDRQKRGSALRCIDDNHPSDLGYTFFGRYLADAILCEWNKTNS
uniref:SGNH hydrolase-type esterase domain-containing protein n=1 Tax=Attheya septentrionalis TaxID=420275 RepID=A0A7S2URW2_9STRA|mmetsp:Transcript_9849/g.17928  ORF Transcript_9849/g.17928 Transcript_9849/m.17928 type:complete len:719 (+) Transcript_9849:157-2313(+)